MAHQGQALNEIISRTPYTKEEIAAKLGGHKRTIYLWISKETLSDAIIDRVSGAIGVDIRKAMPSVFPKKQIISLPSTQSGYDNELMAKYVSTLEENSHLKDELAIAKAELASLKKV